MKRIPGRTQAMCRNRFQRINAPKKAGVKSRNRCTHCGHTKRGHTCTARLQDRGQAKWGDEGSEGSYEGSYPRAYAVEAGYAAPPVGYDAPRPLVLAHAEYNPPTPIGPQHSWHIESGVERAAGLLSPLTGGLEACEAPIFSDAVPHAPLVPPLGPSAHALLAAPPQAGAAAEPAPPYVPAYVAEAPTLPLVAPEPAAASASPQPATDLAAYAAAATAAAGVGPAAEPAAEPAAFAAAAEMPAPPAVESTPPLLSRSRSNISMNMASHPLSLHSIFALTGSCEPADHAPVVEEAQAENMHVGLGCNISLGQGGSTFPSFGPGAPLSRETSISRIDSVDFGAYASQVGSPRLPWGPCA